VAIWLVCPVRARADSDAQTPGEDADSAPAQVSARIDALFERAWKEAGLTPAPLADDASFLRRATLDLTGMIPEVGQVRSFLADARPDKRKELIDDLVRRPRHATRLAEEWREVLLPRTIPESTSRAFETWLATRFRSNQPYDALVREILLARGTLAQSAPVVYYAALDVKPEELAASSSQVFLGLQIRCAQCHDHPFTQWRQEDFWGYAAFFARVRGPSTQGGPAQLDEGPTGEVQHPKTNATIPPRLLDGSETATATGEPRRAILARWITAPENPYFAKAAVNRAWWMMFGRGLVHPVDDLGEHNPPTHPEVLDVLTEDFVSHGHDLRRLFQIIALTQVYQRSSAATADAEPLATYTSMPVRSLSAQQVYNCLLQAAGRREPLDRNDPQVLAERGAFLAQVDAPTRQATEFQGGVPQTLALLNGAFVTELTDPFASDLIAALVDSPFLNDESRVETLYLATVSRPPRDEELERAMDWVRASAATGDKAQALGDVLWALLNSSEFVLNR
jgi:hypothetical protein